MSLNSRHLYDGLCYLDDKTNNLTGLPTDLLQRMRTDSLLSALTFLHTVAYSKVSISWPT